MKCATLTHCLYQQQISVETTWSEHKSADTLKMQTSVADIATCHRFNENLFWCSLLCCDFFLLLLYSYIYILLSFCVLLCEIFNRVHFMCNLYFNRWKSFLFPFIRIILSDQYWTWKFYAFQWNLLNIDIFI